MANPKSISELRARKLALKQEVKDLEELITFEHPKESLSLLTGGATDGFLTEKTTEDGRNKLALKTAPLIKSIGNSIMGRNPNHALFALDHSGSTSNLVETSFRLGSVALMGGLVKSTLKGKGWKNKVLGLALVYVLPVALKFLRQKLENYSRNKSISSIEKLI